MYFVFTLVEYLIITPLAANFIAERSGVMEQFKYWLFYRVYSKKTLYRPWRLKPFDCTMCLSFWLCVVQALIIDRPIYLLLPFASAAIGSIISRW